LHDAGHFWSVGYGILKKKRGEGEAAGGGECVKPNAMGLGDGTLYNLTAMNEELIMELLGYEGAKGSEDLPGHFEVFVM
jgi:hypothetical protein